MKKKLPNILWAILFFTCFVSKMWSQIEQAKASDSLDLLVERYYELNIVVFQSKSTKGDIDRIFELFTDDFTYVHPQYGGVYSREDLYNGYERNQENGGYDGSIVDVKVENKIVGLDAVAVSRRFVKKENDKEMDGELQMTFFEFRNGKICRIYEYW
ncbi:nuclear transport factor 2 family protein [Flagellimonas sediminis]|uniref:DUF4440 domain-containing protein n=1 Tax=Flagellimonas sediminis TaxID=2696468 RepID=A0A6I5KR55_9FLAO|nr:nuclear transport factor 2 family protein [Allomuricauda sediminis]NDV42405.1 DUF4440 domain-containing protein [Allomuricauda sediminis]